MTSVKYIVSMSFEIISRLDMDIGYIPGYESVTDLIET